MKKLLFLLLIFVVGCTPIKNTNENIENIFEPEIIKEDDLIDNIVNKMSLEEKVGQIFIVDFFSLSKKSKTTHLTPEIKKMIEDYNIGGVIFFADNIVDETQLEIFMNELKNTTKIPLFISIDEEGGKVSRLSNNENIEMDKFEKASEIGKLNDENIAYLFGKKIGNELKKRKFNMNFAPVADVNSNPKNPVIGERAFGDNEEIVSIMISNVISGMQEEGVASVAKHFPGHGDTALDTHNESVYLNHDIDRLYSLEFKPFIKAIENDVMGIMMAHITLPNICKENVPASMSKEIITEILRKDLGYDNLIITDAFNMKAITNKYSSKEASIKAVNAGIDIILMPEDFVEAYNGIIESVRNNEINEKRIDESVKRVLKVKYKLGLFGEEILY